MLSEPRQHCWELHPLPQQARSKCDPACPVCWHQCHVLGRQPRAHQPPQHGTACTGTRPGSQCCPSPALQVCTQRGQQGSATSACSCRVKQSQPWQARQEDSSLPHLHGFASLYSFFPQFTLPATEQPPVGSRKLNESLEEHHHLQLLMEEHTNPPGAEQIPDRHRVSPRMSVFHFPN